MNTGAEHYKDEEKPDRPETAPANDRATPDGLARAATADALRNDLEQIVADNRAGFSPSDETAYLSQAFLMLSQVLGSGFATALKFQFQAMIAQQDAEDDRRDELADQYEELERRRDRKADEDKKRDDEADAYQDAIEREEERREYEQSQHRFIGGNLTGAEWGELSDKISNDQASRQWLIALMLRDGKTKGEAERDADTIGLAFKGMSKREADRTADEKAAMKRVETDPTLKREAQAYINEQQAPATEREVQAQVAETKSDSANARSNLIVARSDLSAEPITPKFNPAASAAPVPEAVLGAAQAQPRQQVAMVAGLDQG